MIAAIAVISGPPPEVAVDRAKTLMYCDIHESDMSRLRNLRQYTRPMSMSTPPKTLTAPRAGLSGVDRIRPAYAQVAAQLRSIILSGEISPGSRLPNEADMAQSFGVSRTTIREAIRVLSSQGLLVTERGVTGGTFVSRVNSQSVSDLLEIGLNVLTGHEGLTITELLETRELIEGRAARLAASRRTNEDLAALDAMLADESAQSPDTPFEDAFEAHTRFHLAIADAAHNRLLVVIIKPVFSVLKVFASNVRSTRDIVSHDHGALVNAIRARHAAKAEDLMLAHLSHIRALYSAVDGPRPENASPKAKGRGKA
jgi:DNA-binding FadR family transcriptional regulator